MKRGKSGRGRQGNTAVLDPNLEAMFMDSKATEIHRKGRNTKPRYQRNIVAKTEFQRDYLAGMETNIVAFGHGPAGTGKTHMAVSKGCEMLEKGEIEKLVLSRPVVAAAGEQLGFLPGDIKEKLNPYMLPLYDILASRIGVGELRRLINLEVIELCPLAFMRGRTFNNAVIILDEMQNATELQLKMALTRIGEQSKCFITGDPDQVDPLPLGAESGLMPTIEKLRGAPGVDIVEFDATGVVRSEIVATVLSRL